MTAPRPLTPGEEERLVTAAKAARAKLLQILCQ